MALEGVLGRTPAIFFFLAGGRGGHAMSKSFTICPYSSYLILALSAYLLEPYTQTKPNFPECSEDKLAYTHIHLLECRES